MKLNIPIYLDEEISTFVEKIASKKGIDRYLVVNDLLRGDIKIAETLDRSGSYSYRRYFFSCRTIGGLLGVGLYLFRLYF